MSLFFQQVQHRTALAAGLALLPQTAVVSLANLVSGRLTARYGSRPPMVVGLAIGGVGLGGLALITARASLAATLGPMVAVGFGAALAMPAMTAAVIEHTPKDRAGIGSAVLNASRQVGGVVGIALLGALIGGRGHFVAGLRQGMLVCGALFLVGSALSHWAVEGRQGGKAAR
jgi:DHA2 family methylenomycin A resistance protein-like MFS transporter